MQIAAHKARAIELSVERQNVYRPSAIDIEPEARGRVLGSRERQTG